MINIYFEIFNINQNTIKKKSIQNISLWTDESPSLRFLCTAQSKKLTQLHLTFIIYCTTEILTVRNEQHPRLINSPWQGNRNTKDIPLGLWILAATGIKRCSDCEGNIRYRPQSICSHYLSTWPHNPGRLCHKQARVGMHQVFWDLLLDLNFPVLGFWEGACSLFCGMGMLVCESCWVDANNFKTSHPLSAYL